MRYALIGYGRMGRAIEAEAARRGHVKVAALDVSPDREIAGVEVAFEFTTAEAAEGNVSALIGMGVPVVCGTTGWKPPADLDARARAAGVGAVVSANFSLGMAIFSRVVGEAARLYGRAGDYHPFVWEAHHAAKRDAPSGTARALARVVLEADPGLAVLREGTPAGPVARDVLQIASVRAGHEPGRHVVGFDGEHDLITLEHRARGRAGFALGAVLAAEWLAGRTGLHGFDAVVDSLSSGG
jgi:4-hydroxy-tetrahydrodipicolinate reductase